jgi:TetR/AcrR family transcriptional regulator, repressor for neighboring sulfatase
MPDTASRAPRKRVRRNPEQARAHILDAAIRVLSRQGPDAVGLKEVAAEAGVSHALVTHYFKTYETLVDATVTEAMAHLRKRLIESMVNVPDPTPERLLQLYLDSALEPWYGRMVSWALLTDHRMSAKAAAAVMPDMKLLAGVTERMLAARMDPPPTRAQVEALIVAVWSMAIGYIAGNTFFWRALGRAPGPRRDRDLREAVGAMTRATFGG